MSETSDSKDLIVVPLSADEDDFCLAVIEFGGNLGAAYRAIHGDVASPIAKAQRLISRPEIALRIKKIAEATQEHALISLGSHLLQLADLRDQSAKAGDLRTALAAEVKRGEVVGFYKDKVQSPDSVKSVHIHLPASSPGSLQEWGNKFGKEPVVIDMPS